MVLFDMTFVLVALDNSYLSILQLDYTRFNDVYTNEDLRAIHDNESHILSLKGFKSEDGKYMFFASELSPSNRYQLNLYELRNDDNIQPIIDQIYSLDLGTLPIQ